ncbi:MAG: DUF4340 domain-containing protein [Nitrospira sp.]|nr:DUF4340 domain-containing protein [Nitrospira sp.]
MSRYLSTLLMLVILAGLGGYLYLVEFPAKQQEEKREIEQKQLLSFPETTITELSITTAQGLITFKQGAPGKWSIIAPLQADADTREVQALIRALVTGTVTRTLDKQSSTLAAFGLEEPVTTLTIRAGGQQETLSIGDSGPLSNTLYALRASDQRVVLTTLAPKDFINKSLMTFRRKELLRFTQNDVDRVRLTYPTTEIVIANAAKGQPRPAWKITYPVEAEADQNEVRSLMFRLEDLKALGIIDPGPERDTVATTLTTQKVKITLYTAGGDQSVRLYQPDPQSGEAIAQTTSEGPLYRINPVLIKDLTRDLFNFQDKRLLGLDSTEIAMLSVKTRGQQYVLIHQNGEWVLEDQPMMKVTQEAADLFVSRVANLPAEERVLKQSSPLAPYGLLAPSAEFVATGKDGKTVGKLTLGNRGGDLLYATGQRLHGVFQVRPDLLTQIPSRTELLTQAKDGPETKR